MTRNANRPMKRATPVHSVSRFRRATQAMRLLLIVFAVVAFVLPARACDTPVYRYAMYQWAPMPYAIYYLHNGDPGESFDLLQATIDALRDNEGPLQTNLIFIEIDLTAEEERTLPRSVQEAWDARPEGATDVASYLVSPKGRVVAEGDFADPTCFEGLLDSPARQEITAQLAQGKAGVLVFLTGPDEAENQESELLVNEFIVERGQMMGSEAPDDVGFVCIDRNDPMEVWLIRMLLAVEPDLDEFDKPMVFPVFGRGRTLEPLIGEGINQRNLLTSVEFVDGPCSCEVAGLNPGVDLLIQADWESVASLVAEIYGDEEGNEQDPEALLFPESSLPSPSSVEDSDPASSSSNRFVPSRVRGLDAG